MMKTGLGVWLFLTLAPSCVAMPLQAKGGQDLWRVKPKVPLAQALLAAYKALGKAHGKDAGQFYCVTAHTTLYKPGQVEWVVLYATTTGRRETVYVPPNGHAVVEDKHDDAYVTGYVIQ